MLLAAKYNPVKTSKKCTSANFGEILVNKWLKNRIMSYLLSFSRELSTNRAIYLEYGLLFCVKFDGEVPYVVARQNSPVLFLVHIFESFFIRVLYVLNRDGYAFERG